MAYAGTPAGLAQQAGSSRLGKAPVTAIAVLALGLATVIAIMLISTRAIAPAVGRSDAEIEAQRDATILAGAPATRPWVAEDNARGAFAPDAVGQTAIEKAAAAKARAMSGVPATGLPYQVDERPRGAAPVYEPRGAHGPLP